MVKIKPGVTILGLVPQMTIAIMAADAIFERYGVDCVITSGNDGKHSAKSKHYAGMAVDLRINNLPNPEADGKAIAAELNEALGVDFDVIFEVDHIHCEFEPRRPV